MAIESHFQKETFRCVIGLIFLSFESLISHVVLTMHENWLTVDFFDHCLLLTAVDFCQVHYWCLIGRTTSICKVSQLIIFKGYSFGGPLPHFYTLNAENIGLLNRTKNSDRLEFCWLKCVFQCMIVIGDCMFNVAKVLIRRQWGVPSTKHCLSWRRYVPCATNPASTTMRYR